MDTDDLSDETYEAVILTAEEFNHDLTLWFALLASKCANEEEYLSKTEQTIKLWLKNKNMDNLMDEIFFGDLPGKKGFKDAISNILKNIENLKHANQKT